MASVGACSSSGQVLSPGSTPESPARQSVAVKNSDATSGSPLTNMYSTSPGSDSDPETDSPTRYKASSYIALDSWIYPAFDRLAALGYIPDSTAMVRPWTRNECARLVAEGHQSYLDMDEESAALLASLDKEFTQETRVAGGDRNYAVQVENVYTRFTGIGGIPLRDGFHFSQTVVDDFGRPYGQGANVISGLAARAEAGPLAFYFRGEYQYAAALSTSIYSPVAQQALVDSDLLPFGWNLRYGHTSRVRPIEAYVTLNLHNWQLSFGQQTLWWGPGRTTSLIWSTNAASVPMLRLDSVKPFYLPGPLRVAGPLRFDVFIGRQGGVHFLELGPNFTLYGTQNAAITPPPSLWGVHLTFKPTQNLELGFAHTTIFAGYGRPLTFGTFWHSFSPLGNGQDVDPGKRVTEFNLHYHIPWYRRAIQVYAEGMAWDDPIEGKFVARYAWDPGIYISELPMLHKFDARFEAVYTDLPKGYRTGYFYANTHYPQGYTNYGQIMGSWVGRQGIGGQASTTFWFTPQKKVNLFYRKMVSDVAFFEGGSNSDYGVNATWRVRPEIELNAMGQYERWKFPLLQQTSRSNFTGSIEFRFYPTAKFPSRQGR